MTWPVSSRRRRRRCSSAPAMAAACTGRGCRACPGSGARSGRRNGRGSGLADLLERAGVQRGAAHLHFLGGDAPPNPKIAAFVRSIPIDRAPRPGDAPRPADERRALADGPRRAGAAGRPRLGGQQLVQVGPPDRRRPRGGAGLLHADRPTGCPGPRFPRRGAGLRPGRPGHVDERQVADQPRPAEVTVLAGRARRAARDRLDGPGARHQGRGSDRSTVGWQSATLLGDPEPAPGVRGGSGGSRPGRGDTSSRPARPTRWARSSPNRRRGTRAATSGTASTPSSSRSAERPRADRFAALRFRIFYVFMNCSYPIRVEDVPDDDRPLPHRRGLFPGAAGRGPRAGSRQGPGPPGPRRTTSDAVIREAMVRRSLEENCLICHTEDMIAGQRLDVGAVEGRGRQDDRLGAPAAQGGGGAAGRVPRERYSDREPPPVPSRSRLKEVGSLEVPSEGREPIPGGRRPGAGRAALCRQLRDLPRPRGARRRPGPGPGRQGDPGLPARVRPDHQPGPAPDARVPA